MTAVSRSQQHAAGAALAARRGEVSPASLRDAAREMYDSMTEAELQAMARTRLADLPDRKGED